MVPNSVIVTMASVVILELPHHKCFLFSHFGNHTKGCVGFSAFNGIQYWVVFLSAFNVIQYWVVFLSVCLYFILNLSCHYPVAPQK